jgi:hypothetical protein
MSKGNFRFSVPIPSRPEGHAGSMFPTSDELAAGRVTAHCHHSQDAVVAVLINTRRFMPQTQDIAIKSARIAS